MPSAPLSNGCRDYTITARHHMVERVILTMRERLDEPFSLPEMAKIAYLSPFHFNRVFRQTTGIPPAQFLYALRLEAAKRLLLTTHLSVTDVCYEVGYNSLGTFTTRFTQLVGLSPCHLRRLTEHLSIFHLESLHESSGHLVKDITKASYVSGRIHAPGHVTKAIFVGLFPTPIPQSRPVTGTLLIEPGPYSIGPVPDGCYYIFAAAFPLAEEPLTYLLPDTASLLVGVGQGPLNVKGGQIYGQTDVTLRPVRVTDPPILIALPSLLADRLNSRNPVTL